MTLLEERMRALLRWHPRSWREQHGEVVLATLLDDAEARGLERPTRADAWSIRVHGLGERATPRAAALVAAVGAGVVAAAVLWRSIVYALAAGPDHQLIGDVDAWRWAWIVMQAGVGPACIGAALVMLATWRRASPWLGIVAIGGWIAALAMLTASALWTIVEPVVSADGTMTSVGVSSLPSQVAAVVLVLATLLPLGHALLPMQGIVAWPVAVVATLPLALVATALAQTSLLPFIALVVVMAALAATRRHASATTPTTRPRTWVPATVVALGAITILLALPATALAILTALDAVAIDAAGMRVAVVLLVAGGLTLATALAVALRPRLGPAVWLPAAAFVLATIVTAAASALAPGRPAQEPLLVAAACLAGLGVGLVVAVAARGHVAVRGLGGLVVGVGAAVLIGQTMTYVAAVVWVAAIPLVVVAVARLRRRSGPGDVEREARLT